MTIVAPAQFKTVASFNGQNGQGPTLPPIRGTDGQGYGTTFIGGYGYGVVFKLTSVGLTTLYGFCKNAPNCVDGANPLGIVQATDGYFYGVTVSGGAHNRGTVFRIDSNGNLTSLYSFCSQPNCSDGETPYAPLIQASGGLLYGTTAYGGAGSGTVFKIPTGGTPTTPTTLYRFCRRSGCPDGASPQAALIQAGDGNLYGTTTAYGTGGAGTIFKITPDGALTTMHSFSMATDGQYPWGLIQGNEGNFYGTTTSSGVNNGGTIFKMTPGGAFTTLYSFCSQPDCSDGQAPLSGPELGSDGEIYGTTTLGGSYGEGTTFRITTSGALTTQHNFCDLRHCSGQQTRQALSYGQVQDTSGVFYGTTYYGGSGQTCTDPAPNVGCGTIYTLGVGLGAFVKPQPAVGNVGAMIDILGSGLTGATSVTFNGTAATFTVPSDTLIVATVPTGASNGKIQVVTQSGSTLTSNVKFRVLQ